MMEILTGALSIGKDIVSNNYVTVIVAVAPFILPKKIVFSSGHFVGSALSSAFRRKMGKGGEKVETFIQGRIMAFVNGLNKGLDEDDAKPL